MNAAEPLHARSSPARRTRRGQFERHGLKQALSAVLQVAWLCACSSASVPPQGPAAARPASPSSSGSAPRAPGPIAPASSSAEAPAEPERSVSLEELLARVEERMPALDRWQVRLAPVLPCSWPPVDACVQFLVYESAPLPTGTIRFRYRGPVSTVRCLLPLAECALAPAEGKPSETVETQESRAPVPDRAAQQTLLELVLGRQVPERAPAGLAAYAEWLERQGGWEASIRSRVPEFTAWLGAERSLAPAERAH